MRYPKPPPKKTVSRAKAAKLLGVTLRSISRYQACGLLRSERRNGRTHILFEDVQQLQRTPAASMLRVEAKRLRLMSARVAMLEHKVADLMAELDAKLFAG